MERKIGETFEYEGKTFRVKEDESCGCHGCFFYKGCTSSIIKTVGQCEPNCREDNKGVVFVEVQEQPQDEQPQKLNLCEILKYCPQGETFWSPLLGDVKLHDINQKRNFIVISLESGETWDINADGTITFGDVTSTEIMFYPSRKQRDWAKVKYEPKKAKFDPKALKVFDRVLVRFDCGAWSATLFSHLIDSKFANKKYDIICCGSVFGYCIPYNDDTKHLVGTTDEAPDFYRYWED